MKKQLLDILAKIIVIAVLLVVVGVVGWLIVVAWQFFLCVLVAGAAVYAISTGAVWAFERVFG